MTIGALALSPAFDPDVTEYTASTTDATNKIIAKTDDPSAVIKIEVGEDEIENGTSATWASGENTVTITVTDGESVTVYTVVVTKT